MKQRLRNSTHHKELWYTYNDYNNTNVTYFKKNINLHVSTDADGDKKTTDLTELQQPPIMLTLIPI